MRDRFRRVIAVFLDWNITLLPFVLLFTFLTTSFQQQDTIPTAIGILCFLFMVIPFSAFIFRDVIFKGRSLGKRIMRLRVYDKNTLQEPSTKQCAVRNLFLPLYPIEGIVLLFTGRTMGDRVAGTVVLSQAALEEERKHSDPDAPSSIRPKVKTKDVFFVAAIVIGCFIAFFGLIQILLNAQKDTEEYQLAYDYLISSEAFETLNIEEHKIRMNQYSSTTKSAGDSFSRTVEIGFLINFQSFQVVLHNENGTWLVCEECTPFR